MQINLAQRNGTHWNHLILLKVNVQFQKISILSHRRDWYFLGSGESWKAKKFKEMYDTLLEFPER